MTNANLKKLLLPDLIKSCLSSYHLMYYKWREYECLADKPIQVVDKRTGWAIELSWWGGRHEFGAYELRINGVLLQDLPKHSSCAI